MPMVDMANESVSWGSIQEGSRIGKERPRRIPVRLNCSWRTAIVLRSGSRRTSVRRAPAPPTPSRKNISPSKNAVATSEITGVVQKIRDGRPRPANSMMLTGPAIVARSARKTRIAATGKSRSPKPALRLRPAPDQGKSSQPAGRSMTPANSSASGSSGEGRRALSASGMISPAPTRRWPSAWRAGSPSRSSLSPSGSAVRRMVCPPSAIHSSIARREGAGIAVQSSSVRTNSRSVDHPRQSSGAVAGSTSDCVKSLEKPGRTSSKRLPAAGVSTRRWVSAVLAVDGMPVDDVTAPSDCHVCCS